MPELPEVETVRRQLEPELVGRRIEGASVLDERLTRPETARSVERAVEGREVTAVARRGKYLLVGLEGGRTLALHLRMTGTLELQAARPRQLDLQLLRALLETRLHLFGRGRPRQAQRLVGIGPCGGGELRGGLGRAGWNRQLNGRAQRLVID
jgi:formamidopyrimidine-DNA glycosylase